MITFLGILGVLITILVAVPATLIAIASIIEHPIRTIVALWITLVETYKDLWHNITK
jgi:hypothetical protein